MAYSAMINQSLKGYPMAQIPIKWVVCGAFKHPDWMASSDICQDCSGASNFKFNNQSSPNRGFVEEERCYD